MLRSGFTLLLLLTLGCGQKEETLESEGLPVEHMPAPYLQILGTAQDAGAPQLGCLKSCCASKANSETVVSLALVDSTSWYLFEATPDITTQVRTLTDLGLPSVPEGVFLSHAHIGHYTGLMYFGREVMNAPAVPVYVMPRMVDFLSDNGPWSQLVALENIRLNTMAENETIRLSDGLVVTPFLVPHRDEFSETAGFTIRGPNHSALFIPDIDKWQLWDRDIKTAVEHVDYAFLDATFFDASELPNRDIAEIPHPLVTESMELFDKLPPAVKNKIYFIHFNHTNPLLNPDSKSSEKVLAKGYRIARTGMRFPM